MSDNPKPGGHLAVRQPPAPGRFLHKLFSFLFRVTVPAILLGLLLGGGAIVDSASAATKKRAVATKKKATARTTTRRAPAKKATARKRASTAKRSTTARRARTVRRRAPARSARFRGPQSPSPDRLREIQQALLSNGFTNVEPNGKWDEASASAMKRFQEEHDIKPNGKINALSLIALGLGPKRGPAPGATSVLETPQTTGPAIPEESNERE